MNQNKLKDFINRWKDGGQERQHTRDFWEELVEILLDVPHGRELIEWEKRVPLPVVTTEDGKSTRYIDCYLPGSKLIIEQKSNDVPLDKQLKQSGKQRPLDALGQAQAYYNQLNKAEQGDYILACNFLEFRVADQNAKAQLPVIFKLTDLKRRWKYLRRILLGETVESHDARRDAAAKTASEMVKRLYDLLKAEYKKDELTRDVLHQMNVFCVRVVFCLYADDSGLFPDGEFQTFLQTFPAGKLQEKFKWLFDALNKKEKKREETLDVEIRRFPYVNGGLFSQRVEIPRMSEGIRQLLIESAEGQKITGKDGGEFSWSEISPTNFGCIFESTLDPETQKVNGMHYTSPANIHRVIDPLFLNQLKAELQATLDLPQTTEHERKEREKALKTYQRKLARLRFLDPACGSGNFLTETFKSLRRLEMEAVAAMSETAISPCLVNIGNFYGIEINDFAAQVARAALWISDCQMADEERERFNVDVHQLPLRKNDNIKCGNALTTDWESVVKPGALDYIIGNPPFSGARGGKDSPEDKLRKKQEMKDVMSDRAAHNKKVWDGVGDMDYVCAWYAKAAHMMLKNPRIRTALVSTNSIVQGEQAVLLWKPLMQHFGLHIQFAWRTFKWENEAKQSAQVHCVIVGFYLAKRRKAEQCYIYQEGKEPIECDRINNYLMPAETYFINPKLKKPICDVSKIGMGNQPIDDGNYIFTKVEMEEFVKKEPMSAEHFHPIYGAAEFTSGVPRYCLWLGDCEPYKLDKMPQCKKRVENVEEYRMKSPRPQTRKLADTPTRFGNENMPKSDYLVLPETTSQRRKYIPLGYMSPDILCTNLVRLMPNVTGYHFGVLESRLHMIWMRTVCGRMKSDYRYSIEIVYNNFPWPSQVSEETHKKIEETAKAILDARSNHPTSTLKQLYDPQLMPPDLVDAHRKNDLAVFEAYAPLGIRAGMSDEEIALILLRESVRLSTLPKKEKKGKKNTRNTKKTAKAETQDKKQALNKKNRDTIFFLSFCIEHWKTRKGISGAEASKELAQYGVLDYLTRHYDTLHTQSHQWLMEDIDEFIKLRKEKQS